MTRQEFERILAPNGGGPRVDAYMHYFKKKCTEKLGRKPTPSEMKQMYLDQFDDTRGTFHAVKEKNYKDLVDLLDRKVESLQEEVAVIKEFLEKYQKNFEESF